MRTHAALEEEDAGGAECLGGADDRPRVAWILEGIEHDDERRRGEDVVEGPLGRAHERDHALRGFSGGDAIEERVGEDEELRAAQPAKLLCRGLGGEHDGHVATAAKGFFEQVEGLGDESPSRVRPPRAIARRTSFTSGFAALVIVSTLGI